MRRESYTLESMPTVVDRWCSHLGLNVKALFEASGDEAAFPNRMKLEGPDTPWLMSNRGQALDALQYLLHEAQGERDSEKLVYLDVQSFRLFRMKELQSMAVMAAKKARETGSYTFSPLSPRERRWVHLTIDTEPDLATESEGVGHFKTLKVFRK